MAFLAHLAQAHVRSHGIQELPAVDRKDVKDVKDADRRTRRSSQFRGIVGQALKNLRLVIPKNVVFAMRLDCNLVAESKKRGGKGNQGSIDLPTWCIVACCSERKKRELCGPPSCEMTWSLTCLK